MFNKVSYRRGVIEGLFLFTLGRFCALISPVVFPDWTYVAAPLLFMVLQFIFAPFWTTKRIAAAKRERLSRRFWLLGPLLAVLSFVIDLVITLAFGLPVNSIGGVQHGSALQRLLTPGPNALTMADFGLYELKTLAALLALSMLTVICTKLAQGGFLRFTMPAGGNRVTL